MSKITELRNLSTFVPVRNCRICGSIIPYIQGIIRHQRICRLMDQLPNRKIEQMVVVNFPCPLVTVKRISLLSKYKRIDSCNKKIPPKSSSTRRKSSLRALEKLRQVAEEVDDNSHQDSEHEMDMNLSNASESDSESEMEVEESAKPKKPRTKLARPSSKPKGNPIPKGYKYNEKTYYPLWCSHCPARFHVKERLQKHEHSVHGEGSKGIPIFTCPICERMFNGRLLVQSHIKLHENGEALEQSLDLWNKWPPKSSTTKSKSTFSSFCKYCVIPLRSHDMFVRHMKADHKDKIDGDSKYSCIYCTSPEENRFDSMKLLIEHIKTSHSIKYCGSEKNPSEKPVKVRADKYINNPYACPVKGCVSRLKSISQLKAHFILHLENNPYACPIPGCNTKLDAPSHYRRHMEWHMGKNLIPCERCGIHFCRRDKMLKHLRLKRCKSIKQQEGIKLENRKDIVDGNGFLRSHFARVKLVDNEEVVSGIKKAADIKRKIDESEAEYSKRLRIKPKVNINDIIKADPVFIQVCKENPGFRDLMFKLPGKNRTHDNKSESGEKYKCTKCEKWFSTLQKLKDHHGRAHAPRPHQCSLCSKSFIQEQFLKSHMKYHESTGNKVYFKKLENGMFQCVECKAESEHETSIKNHLLAVHKITLAIVKRGRRTSKTPQASASTSADLEGVHVAVKEKEAEVPANDAIVKTESEPMHDVTMIVCPEDVKIGVDPLADSLCELSQDFINSSVVAPAESIVLVENDTGSTIFVKQEFE